MLMGVNIAICQDKTFFPKQSAEGIELAKYIRQGTFPI